MHIPQITSFKTNKIYPQIEPRKKDNEQNNIQHKDFPKIDYSGIAFGAIYNVKTKNINIEAEKNKLLKQILEILETNTQDTDITDIITSAFRKALGSVRIVLEKRRRILQDLDNLLVDKTLNPQQKSDRVRMLRKEYSRLEKYKPAQPKTKPSKIQDEKIDYQLMNKFKTAISEDNFNLRKIFLEYYSNLNNIKTIEELKEQYPKIKIPPRPEEVIAKKIESVLTRDFYEELDKVFENGSQDNIVKFLEYNITKMTKLIAQKFNVNPENLFQRTGIEISTTILKKYEMYKVENRISSIPEQRKIKFPQITDIDIKMLAVDFDDFVISSVRKHYLEGQKFNDLTYSNQYITLPLAQLKVSDYKFEKIPEKIKGILNSADTLHAAQRDYENFDTEKFKSRLNFYANREPGNNEDILTSIINFDTCNFTEEDKKLLIQFLKELDRMNDGEKTISQVIETIQTKGLEPKGTQKLNEIEKQKAEQSYKIRQKEISELNSIKKDFDDVINTLYANNLNNLANSCSKYRPNSLDKTEIGNAKFLIKMIADNIDPKNKKLSNKNKLEQNIIRWDTYNLYKNNKSEKMLFEKAIEFASEPDGTINIDKAGQYLVNSEVVQLYPMSLEATRQPEILEKIMEKAGTDTDMAIRYLCKFDNYLDMNPEDKQLISNFIDFFNQKDAVEKAMLKYIIENDYINSDTSVLTNIHETGNPTIKATIASSAKKQILDKYKYPLCIDYMRKFEDALSSFAKMKNSSGIKQTGRNNETIRYKMELKIAGEDDRLFSSNNNYYFDIFSDKGMH